MTAPYLVRCRLKLSLFPILLFAGLHGLAARDTLLAQAPPPAAIDQSPEEKAKSLVEAEQNFEAAELYQTALIGHQKRLEERPDDSAIVTAWASCRNGLAEQRASLHQFREARDLFAGTLERLQAFLARHPRDTPARIEMARNWEQLCWCVAATGVDEEATRYLCQALDIHRKLAAEPGALPERRTELARVLTGYAGRLTALARCQEATAAYEEALTVGRKLLADCPDSRTAIESLAITCNGYALPVRETGQYARAAEMIREAIRLLTKLETQYPDHPEYWSQLPIFYRNLSLPLSFLGNANEAALAKQESDRLDAKLAKFPDAAKKYAKDTYKIHGAIQTLDLARMGGLQAETASNLQTAEANFRLHPEVPVYRYRLSGAKLALGVQLAAANKPQDEFMRAYTEALDLSEKLVEQCPDVPAYRTYSATVRNAFGIMLGCTGQTVEADQSLDQGVAWLRKLADEHPAEPALRYKMTENLIYVLAFYMRQPDWKRATRTLALIRTELKKLVDAYPASPVYRRSFIQMCEAEAYIHAAEGDDAAHEASCREIIVLWRRMILDFPANPDNRSSLGLSLTKLGLLLLKQGRYPELRSVTEETLHIHEEMARAFPANELYLAQVAADHSNYAVSLEREGKTEAALQSFTLGVQRMEEAVRLNPRRRDLLTSLRGLDQNLADSYLRQGKQEEYQVVLTRMKGIEEYLDSPLIRVMRVGERFEQGNRSAALREADDLFSNCDLTASLLDDLAAFYAKASGSEPQTTDREIYAVRAVETLQRACNLGRMSFVALDADPRFRALVDRADFKKLVAEQRK